MANEIWPIWKDTNTLQLGTIVTGSIYKSSSLVMEDYFYAPPGEGLAINLNRYAETMIDVPDLDDYVTGEYLELAFSRSFTPVTWTLETSPGARDQYRFYLNWSYDEPFEWSSYVSYSYSKPISRKFTEGQYLLQSWYGRPTASFDRHYYFDNVLEATIPVNPGAFSHAGCLVHTCATTCSTEDWTWDEHVDADYAIYYLNLYGGFDSFPLEGKCLSSVDYQRYSVTNSSRYRYDYKVGKEIRWTLNTGLLRDEESVLMDNILSSPLVYLHHINKEDLGYQDLRTCKVRIDTNSIQKKTFKNQDRNFPSYEFQVVECQQRIRR